MALKGQNPRESLIIGIDTFVLFLGITSTILRLYAAKVSKTKLWLDYYFMAVGVSIASGTCVCHFVAIKYGFGRHVQELSHPEVTSYLKVFFTGQICWITASTTIKLAVLLFYWRIFPSPNLRRATYFMAIFIICYFIACIITFVMQCYPAYAFWQPNAAQHCINRNTFYIASAALGLLTDVSLVAMPMPVLWGLKMSTKKKVGISGIFFLGGCVCVISLCRLFALNSIDPKDITWTNVSPGLWSASEVQVGVFSANLPSLSILFRRFFEPARTIPDYNNTYLRPSRRTFATKQSSAPSFGTESEASV